MNSLATKRIMNDLKILKRSNLEKENIFVSTNDDDIYNLKALIIGPSTQGAPYQGGFIFLILHILKIILYPHLLLFFVLWENTKKLDLILIYIQGGKVCLSLLGTWSDLDGHRVIAGKDVLIVLQSHFTKILSRMNQDGRLKLD